MIFIMIEFIHVHHIQFSRVNCRIQNVYVYSAYKSSMLYE